MIGKKEAKTTKLIQCHQIFIEKVAKRYWKLSANRKKSIKESSLKTKQIN